MRICSMPERQRRSMRGWPAWSRRPGIQLVVVTLPSLQGYEIEQYGYQLGRAWGIGQKGKNNGALLIVAPNEHRVRIEVGYGLEGTLTDAVSRLIIENAILPSFRVNDYAGGISRGVDDIVQALSGDSADFKRRAAEQANPPAGPGDYAQLIWVLLIIGLWLYFAFRSRRRGYGGGMPWIVPVGGGWSSPGGGAGAGAAEVAVSPAVGVHLAAEELRADGDFSRDHAGRPHQACARNPGGRSQNLG